MIYLYTGFCTDVVARSDAHIYHTDDAEPASAGPAWGARAGVRTETRSWPLLRHGARPGDVALLHQTPRFSTMVTESVQTHCSALPPRPALFRTRHDIFESHERRSRRASRCCSTNGSGGASAASCAVRARASAPTNAHPKLTDASRATTSRCASSSDVLSSRVTMRTQMPTGATRQTWCRISS